MSILHDDADRRLESGWRHDAGEGCGGIGSGEDEIEKVHAGDLRSNAWHGQRPTPSQLNEIATPCGHLSGGYCAKLLVGPPRGETDKIGKNDRSELKIWARRE